MQRKQFGQWLRTALAAAAFALLALAGSAGASSAQRSGHQVVRGDLSTAGKAASSSLKATQIRDISLELVAQAINSPAGVTPATSIQYGYLSYLRGLSIFNSGPQNETTALFTFYTETTVTRVISNGPLRVITREGTVTIYRDPSANGNFSTPDSFRDGTPVLVAGLRQQGIVDTATGAFTLTSLNTIISSSPFSTDGGELQLGKPGDKFRSVFNGHLNSQPAPPTGYLAGYTFSVS
jgi:hypothetical protein